MLKKLKPLKFGVVLIISVILTLGFSISLQSLLATWTAPSTNPPTNNISSLLVGGGLAVNENTALGGDMSVVGSSTIMGNVGIGTSSPGARLDVYEKIDTYELSGTFACNAGDTAISYKTSAKLCTGSGLCSPSSCVTPFHDWSVAGNYFDTCAYQYRFFLSCRNGTCNSTPSVRCQKPQKRIFSIDPTGTYIDSNVGIGTTTMSDKLTVIGNTTINGNINNLTNSPFYINSNADMQLRINVNGSSLGNFGINNSVNSRLLTMLDNGNIGIGTTSPVYKLDIRGGSINASDGLCIAGDCKTNWPSAGWETNGVNIYNINTGNVGIGTTTPAQKLSVKGIIETTSGGIKFPDGTIQTTAASGGVNSTLLLPTATNPSGTHHSAADCTSAGGTFMLSGSLYYCKFTSATTPSGWTVLNKYYNCPSWSNGEGCPTYCTGQLSTSPTCVGYYGYHCPVYYNIACTFTYQLAY